jgi:ATP phosphoribosyltransferase
MRIALPKGRLFLGVLECLTHSGITFEFANDRDYSPRVNLDGFTAKILKARAVPQLVALGNFPVGFCGLDLVVESQYPNLLPKLDLGLNPVRLIAAVPKGCEYFLVDPPKRPLVIATEYVNIASRWAMDRGFAHIVVQTYGSTEGYAPSDADIVFDCVETGRTLEANGLVVVDEITPSTTHFVVNQDLYVQNQEVKRKVDLLLSLLAHTQKGGTK